MQFRLTLLLLVLVCFGASAQKKYKVGAIGFYNLENLFDTLDTPNKNDAEFTPTGSRAYGTKVYQEKLHNLSTVISKLGTELSPDGLAALGVSEIENRSVLEDLVKMPALKERNYQIAHHESPDERGIDVGFLYNPNYFKMSGSKPLRVNLSDGEDEDFTRDILWVWGKFDNEPIHFFVCHWPSRRGGEAASSPLREKAASVARGVIDSLLKEDNQAKIILMGDLNDDPVNNSVTGVLNASGKIDRLKGDQLYNPWAELYKKGIGTLAWGDAWNLFDQIIISQGLLDKTQSGFFFHKPEIYNKGFLVQANGRYKGYPFRTYSGGQYIGGYSDHFPVFIYLLKEVE